MNKNKIELEEFEYELKDIFLKP